jgi:hypothetical protein
MGFTNNGTNAPHLYRSTNGGAQWTNISSNLPNAPANSVVIDPNDANTLYIAMDTGVYVTTQVSTCDTVNCWSIYGTSLPNAPVVQLAAAQAMPTGDGRSGELRAATYGRGIWQIPLLNAIGSTPPVISLNPASLTFSAISVGATSAPQTITVTNTGASALNVSQLAISQTSAPSQFNEPDFTESDTCTSAAVAPNSTCTVQISFLPATTGTRTAVLTVYGNVSGGQATAQLTGNATPSGAIVLTPTALAFPATVINASSPAQNITISNIGATTLALQPPFVTGDFKLSANTCGTTLAPQVGCTVSIVFLPTASGARTGTFTLNDGAGTQTASLTGAGDSPATDSLSPASLTFAATQITTSSPAQQVILTNSGDLPLTLIAAQITSGDFTAVNNCGNSLNPHTSCSISVAFQPKDLGTLIGTLSVVDQYGKPQLVTLNGTGIAPPGVSLAPFSTVAFPNTGVGLSAPAQLVTLTNNDATTLLIQSILVTGDYSVAPGSNTCGASVAPFSACTMQVVFTPTTTGPRSGRLTVTDNASNPSQTLTLTGTGIDFTLTPDGSTNLTITSGQNAVFPVLVSSPINVPGTVTFSCQGTPANSTCNVTPSTVTLGATTTVSFTILTGVASTQSAATPPQRKAPFLWLATLLPLLLIPKRRGRLPQLLCALLLCTLLSASGCGAGREIPLSGNPTSTGSPGSGTATPAGTYTVVASASSAGLTRSLTLTLTVQ